MIWGTTVLGRKCVGHPRTRAVEEALGVLGQLVVDDQVDIGDVQAAGSHVGGHKHSQLQVERKQGMWEQARGG